MRGTGNRLWLMVGLVAALTWPGVAVAASTITGTVTFDGKTPNLKPIAMDAEPVCHKKHGGKPAPAEMLILGGGNTMGNIMVWVSKGLPAGKAFPAPKTPVTLDQDGCVYKPHVMGIMVGQTYRILNNDGILHNIHTLPKINAAFNRGQPATVKEMTTTFAKPEAMLQVKCDVHPWMTAYIGVFTHPFFAVTSADGKFSIPGLDAGTYEITAWHERLGTQTATVTVSGTDTKSQDFKFAVK
jgi:plastocyanin